MLDAPQILAIEILAPKTVHSGLKTKFRDRWQTLRNASLLIG